VRVKSRKRMVELAYQGPAGFEMIGKVGSPGQASEAYQKKSRPRGNKQYFTEDYRGRGEQGGRDSRLWFLVTNDRQPQASEKEG